MWEAACRCEESVARPKSQLKDLNNKWQQIKELGGQRGEADIADGFA